MINEEYIERLGGIVGIYRDVEIRAVSGDDIRRIESRIGAPLPIEYAQFLRAHGAGCFTFGELVRFDVPQVADGHANINHFYSAIPRADFFLYDVAAAHDEYVAGPRRMVPDDVLPIADMGSGDLLCLNIGNGAILYWDHYGDSLDINNKPTHDALYPIAPSLSDFIGLLHIAEPE